MHKPNKKTIFVMKKCPLNIINGGQFCINCFCYAKRSPQYNTPPYNTGGQF